MIPASLKRADMVIAVSESTKKDILRNVDIEEDKVSVIHEGYDKRFRKTDSGRSIVTTGKYGIRSKYLLFVGMLEPRKNISRLIDAYGLLSDETRSEYSLVIAGAKGWMYEDIFRSAGLIRSPGKVIFTGHVPDDDLVDLYNGAELFIYPSLYEGFGLPVIEAMACGVPVITSNISSLPEVSGNAARLIDPVNIADIKDSMEFILSNSSVRQGMIEKGLENVKRFSYEKMAKETLGLYNKAVN